MRYPEFLKEKGTIGFVAPSFGCSTEPYRTAFDEAQRKFEALGHKLHLGPNCYEGKGIGISNLPEECGRELQEWYLSGDNGVLVSCGGGELMCQVLDHIDFEAIKKARPKWYMGYSDNTNFTFLLATLCDTASIYGPCVASFGMEPWDPAIQDAYDLLCGRKLTMGGYPLWEKESLKNPERPLEPYHLTEEKRLVYAAGDGAVMEGRLLGGCVDCLINLLGTCYDKVGEFQKKYQEDGVIWFLEACELNVMAMRRAFWQMDHAGWFRHAKGFLIGRPESFGQELMGLDQYEAVMGVLGKYQVPVIMDADLGHLPPMMPLICGAKARVEAKGNEISIQHRLG